MPLFNTLQNPAVASSDNICHNLCVPVTDHIGVGVGIGVVKEIGMPFGHEKVAMLTKLGQRGYAVREEAEAYRTNQTDPDTDTDPDPERQP
jgi:hypothetical protein